MKEELIADEKRPGVELLHFRGAPGCHEEELLLSNSLGNGLRFQILNDDIDGWAEFHINDLETARAIAARLVEWSSRIANPASSEA